MTVEHRDLTPAEAHWDSLVSHADSVEGADLEKGANLLGVPLCITRAVFREGDFTNQGITGWYVSLEAIVAPAHEVERAIRRGKIPDEIKGLVYPGDSVVFNESGTGIYRQIVSYLEAKGKVSLDQAKPEGGKWMESRYDTLPPEWKKHSGIIGDNGEITFDITLLCPRGLRESKYANEGNKQSVTRYLG